VIPAAVMSPRLLGVLLAAPALGLAFPDRTSQASGQATSVNCRQPGETVIARDRSAVVVAETVSRSRRRTDFYGVYGCLRRTGRRFRLDPDNEQIRGVRLNRRSVAYEAAGYDGEEPFDQLRVMDLRNGEFAIAAGAACYDCRVFRRFVVKPNGSVAYIVGERRFELKVCEQACLSDPDVLPRRVDRGRGIVPRSLKLRGSRIYWRHGSRRRCARLR
jgi:hypothetical protein